MGHRKHVRVKNVLPIRCWGTDATGKPFVEVAHTLDVSHKGVRVGGFTALVAVGDVVNVQYRHRKAKFEVAWVGRPGSSRNAQIGIRCLEAAKDIFSLGLTDKQIVDDYEVLESKRKREHVESRTHTRFNATGGADLLTVATHEGSWGQLADISRGGCYLSTLNPLNVGLEVELLLQSNDVRVNAYGTIRTCHPGVGMGIEFTAFRAPMDKESLEGLVQRLETGEKPQVTSETGKPDAKEVAARLQAITQELYGIEQLMKSSTLNPEILYDFRESVSSVRNTGWALQRWMELKENNENPFPVLSYLNTERIRLATRTCRSLYHDMRMNEVKSNKKQLNDLLRAVEDLFTHLAGIDFTVLDGSQDEQDPEPEMTSHPPKAKAASDE
jgi:hypothetical protein